MENEEIIELEGQNQLQYMAYYRYIEREVLDRMMMMASMPVLAYYSSTTTKVLNA
jgi:hypothetical protein